MQNIVPVALNLSGVSCILMDSLRVNNKRSFLGMMTWIFV